MKKALTVALICASLAVFAPNVSAAQAQRAGLTPRTPVAGVTRQEDPQPATRAALTTDANRKIRWEPWEYRSAFSASVLEQIQDKIDKGEIKLGTVSIEENESLFKAVQEGAKNGIKALQDALESGEFDIDALAKSFKLKVWTYRHNYGDKGLYQLYVSGIFQVHVGDTIKRCPCDAELPFKDIQAIQYEFDDPDYANGGNSKIVPVYACVELYRGAVAYVDAKGFVTVTGNEGGVDAGYFDADEKTAKPGKWNQVPVNPAPFAEWELASVLPRDAYNPAAAKDRPPYFHPSDRYIPIPRKAGEAKVPTTDPSAGMQVDKVIKVRKFGFFLHR
ncbi:MAG: hypothetical protein LBT46_04065 [Planctomycetaceae bacterium]|jgi:hypothetical protein|nr:hypothetical protein [Planctomycetaceae bacterium]